MMKEQIIEILEDIQPEADYETCQTFYHHWMSFH